MSLIKNIEKTPMQSKKFLAYLFANLINKALIFWMIKNNIGGATIAWAITAAAFIDVGYILGQAALDGFVRMAQIKFFPKTKEELSPKEGETATEP
jgi:hypothetical protein